MSALDALLGLLPRTSLIVGKGGVGKTTCAAGIAAAFAERGDRTLLISTDPAASLSTVLGARVSSASTRVPGRGPLEARQLDAVELRREFLAQWRDTIVEILDRGTYLDRDDVNGLVDAALPGADEIFALLALADLIAERGDDASGYARLVVDTAPTGHTLRLLALPETFGALVSMLDLMQDKHRFMVRTLTRRYRRDRADDFLDTMRARIDALRAALADDTLACAVLVTRAEPMVLAESRRYLDDLAALHVRVAAVIVNALPARDAGPALSDELARFSIPLAAEPPRALADVVTTMSKISAMREAGPSRAKSAAAPQRAPRRAQRAAQRSEANGAPALAALVRTLTIVAGKGGVGKSTVSCALGIAAADAGAGPILLVSTDPAPSLADALDDADADWARTDVEHEVADAPGLVVRQMDAGAAFSRVRDEYQARIDALFDALVGRGIDVERDRAIVRDLLALAPPGIDELFALSLLGDALAERRFESIIVDPAPTGHLLRLIDMPAIALDWSHRLMRLMLKYQEVVAFGDTAAELLAFTKRTRALDALVHDGSRASAVVVALDEPVVRAESERLVAALEERRVEVGAVVWNRVARESAPLPESRARRHFFADEIAPSPVGVTAIREWSQTWRELSSTS